MKKRLVVTRNIDPTSMIYGSEGVTDITNHTKGFIKALKKKNVFVTEIIEVDFPESYHPSINERASEINAEICNLQIQIAQLEREKKKLP